MSDREFGDGTVVDFSSREWCNIVGLKESKDVFSFVCRLMPSFGSCRNVRQGEMVKHGVHYGFKGLNKRNPEKTVLRPFLCIEKTDFNTKQVLVACPMCELIADRKQELENLDVKCKSQTLTEEEAFKVKEPLLKWIKDFNLDRKWYMNVYSVDNKFYTLKITQTCRKDELVPLLDKLEKGKNINPYAFDQGVWLNFTRTGFGRNVVDKVEPVMETVTKDGDTFEKIKKAPLSQEIVERAKNVLNDLKLDLFPSLTAQQIKLLTQCSGDPEEVDAIFNVPTTNKTINTKATTSTTTVLVKSETVTTKPSDDSVKSKIQDIVNNPVAETDPAEDFYNQIK